MPNVIWQPSAPGAVRVIQPGKKQYIFTPPDYMADVAGGDVAALLAEGVFTLEGMSTEGRGHISDEDVPAVFADKLPERDAPEIAVARKPRAKA